MRRMTSCTLIGFRPDAHEVGTDPVSTRRTVKCQELSLTLAEAYQAGGDGLKPEAKLLIPYDRDYQGERALEYGGERWTVMRDDPYKDWNGVILTIRRDKGNSGSAEEDSSAAPQDDTEGTTVSDTHGAPQEVGE